MGKKQKFLALFERKNQVDILLTHDWPEKITPEGVQLRGSRPMGNSYSRKLTDELKPQVHLCGHMHTPYRHQIVAKVSGAVNSKKTPGKSNDTVNIKDTNKNDSRNFPQAKSTNCNVTKTDICCLSKVGMSGCITLFEFDLATQKIREVVDGSNGLGKVGNDNDDSGVDT